MIVDLRDWLPYRADLLGAEPGFDWCHTGRARLTRPFFAEDAHRLLSLPFNEAFTVRTTIDEADAHLAAHPPLAPTAFIFHLSRCGSTLVAQMLAADPANRVLSEPAPLDQALRAPLRTAVAPDTYHHWLRTTLGALGQPATGEHRLFVKLDAWAAVAADHLAAAFPDVPWLVLYRDPVEVLVSATRTKPLTLLPGIIEPELFGIGFEEAVSLPEEEYGARVLGFLLERFAAMADRASLIEYPDLPGAVWPWLAGLGIEPEPATRRRMEAVTRRHAKFPDRSFAEDRAAKQAAATAEQRRAVSRWATPAYERLGRRTHRR